MSKHWQYLKYVLQHKWFVFLEGLKIGPEHWYQWPLWVLRLALHDWDKFTSVEWFPYVRRFAMGNDFTLMGDDVGYHMAYHMHMRRNKHHWQWWVTQRDGGKYRVLPMDALSCREFVADMRGQGRTVGFPDTAGWFMRNRNTMLLYYPDTLEKVAGLLGIPGIFYGLQET